MADTEYLVTDKILHEYDKSLKKKISEIFISKNTHKLATDEISYIKTNYSSLSKLESTKEEVLQQLSDYKNIIVKYVMELPVVGEEKVCYILQVWKNWRPPTDMLDYDIPDPDYYELYYYINNKFELFGSTKVDYNNVAEIKDLPTKVSQLENDAKYISESTQFTKLSQFENDANYVTRASIPTNISSFNNDSGYITKLETDIKLSGKSDTTHNHDNAYVKLSGSTITNNINKDGVSCNWIDGRTNAIIKTNATSNPSDNQYVPCISAKSYQGSWEMGTYTNNDYCLTYITDDNFNANVNQTTAQYKFCSNGTLTANKFQGEVITLNGYECTID